MSTICPGAVFKQFNKEAGHFKMHIIVAEMNGDLATVFINTNARYSELPTTAQGSQYPIEKADFSFLDHDSFIDCSDIWPFGKSHLNTYLQRNKGHHLGHVNNSLLQELLRMIRSSRIIEISKKKKFGLFHS